MGLMLSDDVKQISMGALQQINLDTIQCERMYCMLKIFPLHETSFF